MGKRANGEGTIYKSESKKCWVGQLSFADPLTGKKLRKTFYGKTQKEVKAKIEDAKASMVPFTDETSIAELAKKQIEHDHSINVLKDVSYKRKCETLKILEKYKACTIPIAKIKDNDILSMFKDITSYSNSVISKVYGLMNATFKQAVMLKIIPYNLLDNKMLLKKPISNKQTKKVVALTVDEQRNFLAVLSENNNILYKEQFIISMFTGARMGEINALSVSDINFNNKTISINKTVTRDEHDRPIIGDTTKTYAGTRTLHVGEDIINLIKRYLNTNEIESGTIFHSKSGNVITTSQVNMEFKRICQKYGVSKGYDVNQHMLRHTYATRCIESGMPAPVLQKVLGHTDISTTVNTYTDVFAEYERKNVDKTQEYFLQQNLTF